MTHRSSLFFAVVVPALIATSVIDGAAAQTDSASLAAQVDELFAQWDKPDSPGCACAVMRDGEVVYSRGYGMANLELDVPLTPQSRADPQQDLILIYLTQSQSTQTRWRFFELVRAAIVD